jgi:hypothetical protein
MELALFPLSQPVARICSMTYVIEAYVELGSENNRMWLARTKCLDFSEGRRRAYHLVVAHRYRALGPVIARVVENRSGRVRYRVQN